MRLRSILLLLALVVFRVLNFQAERWVLISDYHIRLVELLGQPRLVVGILLFKEEFRFLYDGIFSLFTDSWSDLVSELRSHLSFKFTLSQYFTILL